MDQRDPAHEPPEAQAVPDPEMLALEAEAAELRRQVEAGAGTPEELRALAGRLREHREREELVWRRSVRPALKRPESSPRRSVSLSGGGPVGLLAVTAAVVVAAVVTQNVVLAVVPVVALLAWAYAIGRRSSR
jgi:hypothetical protein